MANEVTTKTKMTISTALSSDFAKGLATSLHLTDEQLRKAQSKALQLSSNENLKRCNPYSLLRFTFEIARYDFVNDDAIYPVPYGDAVQAQMGYKAFLETAYRSGKYKAINAVEVKDCDKVTRNRETGEIEVTFEEDIDKYNKAKRRGWFAYATDKESGQVVASLYMSDEEVKAHSQRYSKTAKNPSGVWAKNYDSMAKKTALRMLYKKLDVTSEMKTVKEIDQMTFRKDGSTGYDDNPLNVDYEIKSTETTVSNTLTEEGDEDGQQQQLDLVG